MHTYMKMLEQRDKRQESHRRQRERGERVGITWAEDYEENMMKKKKTTKKRPQEIGRKEEQETPTKGGGHKID